MTLVADSVDETEVVPIAAPPAKSTAARPVPIVVALVWALVAFIVCWSLLLLTQGPFGNVWFHTRQHHLASGILVGEKTVLPGQALGVMQIPAIGLDVVVQEGDDAAALRSGPGHHIGTPRPGQIGNSVVVGHREAWGAPFAKLSELKPKDLIVFQNARDTLHNYVFEVRSVVSGVAAADPAPFAHSNDHRITLVTGSGGRFSDSRLVVTAVSGAPVHQEIQFGPPVSPKVNGVSTVTNTGVGLMIVAAILGGAVFVLTRRRYRAATIAVIASPFVAVFLLGLLLEFDYALSPLR